MVRASTWMTSPSKKRLSMSLKVEQTKTWLKESAMRSLQPMKKRKVTRKLVVQVTTYRTLMSLMMTQTRKKRSLRTRRLSSTHY